MKKNLLRTGVVKGIKPAEDSIDRENGVIRGFAVVTKGMTKDERGEFDLAELEKIVSLGNKTKIGIKSRFGHPNMSSTAFGTFLGRVKNFYLDGDIVRADLHVDKTAYKTPNGDLGSYVFDIAESDPDAFGSSMVIYWDPEYKKNEKGNDDFSKPPFIRVSKLTDVDIVDDPAANEGMFNFLTPDLKLSAEASMFLDKFLEQPDAEEKIYSFLERFFSNRSDKNKQDPDDPDNSQTEDSLEHPVQEEKMEEVMEFDKLTLEMLKKERSDLFDQILSEGKELGLKEGKEAGIQEERARAACILEEANGFENVQEIALESIKKGDSKDAALGKFKDKKIADLESSAPKTAGPGDDPEGDKTSHLSFEEKCSKDWNESKELQGEFKSIGSYIAFKKAESEGRVSLIKKS